MLYEELKVIIKNDIDTLSKESGVSTFTKKKTIERLQKSINDNIDLIVENQKDILELLSTTLLHLIKDSLERCRMFSITILSELADRFSPQIYTQLVLQRLLSIIVTAEQFKKEEVEEVRVAIIQLLDTIIRRSTSDKSSSAACDILSAHCESIVSLLKVALADRNPQQIELTTEAIMHLTQSIPNRMLLYTGSLVPCLVKNLSDRHQKIRSLSLMALTEFISKCGSVKIIDAIEQHLPLLAIDHSPNVRNTLAISLQQWMCSEVRSSFRQHNPLLLNCLLSLCASDIPAVLESTQRSLLNISTICLKDENNQSEQQEDNNNEQQQNDDLIKSLSLTWWQPNVMNIDTVSKRYLKQSSKKIMRYYYTTFHQNELDPNSREIKIGILYLMMVYLGEAMTPFIDAILQVLSVEENDMIPSIQLKVIELCRLVGAFIDSTVTLPRLIALIKQEITTPTHNDTLYCQLRILKNILTTTKFNNNNNEVILNLLEIQLQLLYSEQQNRCQLESLEILFIISKRFSNEIQSLSPRSYNLLTRLLILLDLSLKNSNSNLENQFNQITNNILNINYQQFLDNNTNELLEDMIKKDPNHILRYRSYFNILEYLASHSNSIKSISKPTIESIIQIFSKISSKSENVNNVLQILNEIINKI